MESDVWCHVMKTMSSQLSDVSWCGLSLLLLLLLLLMMMMMMMMIFLKTCRLCWCIEVIERRSRVPNALLLPVTTHGIDHLQNHVRLNCPPVTVAVTLVFTLFSCSSNFFAVGYYSTVTWPVIQDIPLAYNNKNWLQFLFNCKSRRFKKADIKILSANSTHRC